MKILLTSAGFENRNLEKIFLGLVNKESKDIRVIFVPTAAIYADAIAVLPKCMNDLLNAGIPKENILVYDLHNKLSYEELITYDAIYFCGGDTKYLLDRIRENKFELELDQFIHNGGTYVGVSAGSIIASRSIENNLGYINCSLSVHCAEGTRAGTIDNGKCPHISLTDQQAILITDECIQVIE